MGSIHISLIAFAFVFGGALLGILLRSVLPSHHLSPESKDVVKLGMGLVGTVAALVLGLLVASAKASYDTQSSELTELASKVVMLDRLLAHYGPETQEVRTLLRKFVAHGLDNMWAKNPFSASPSLEGPSVSNEMIYDKIQALSPKNEVQHEMQTQASSMIIELGKLRWLMYAQRAASVSTTLLVVLIFWLTVIFISFGLFAPHNATVIASLFFSALAVSGAILLILEMYAPYSGLIQVSSAPLRAALARLGQ
jgi:hypothetical protein